MANDGEQKQYYYVSSYTTDNTLSQNLVISQSGNLDLWYDDVDGDYSASKSGTDKTIKYISQAEIICVLDSDVIIDGGTLQCSSILGGNTSQLQAIISGKFTALDLNGYNIYIRNNGNLNGFGIIYNSQNKGGIIVENGTLTTPFCVYGYKGGGGTGYFWANSIAPFENFLCPYLSCETIFMKGGKLVGETSLYAASAKNATSLKLIGNDDESMLQIKSGYIIRRQSNYETLTKDFTYNQSLTDFYDALDSKYRERFIFTNNPSEEIISLQLDNIDSFFTERCNIKLNSLELIADVGVKLNVSMKFVDFPIPSFFDIYMYSTDFVFDISLKFMPNSFCFIDENSEIKFAFQSGREVFTNYEIYARVSTLDSYAFDIQYSKGTSKYSFPSSTYPADLYISERLAVSCEPAQIICEGDILFESYNPDFSSTNYYYYTIGGRIELSKKSLNCLMSNCHYFKIMNFVAQYLYSTDTGGDYYVDYASVNPMPLISGSYAFFQNGDNMDILKGIYDESTKTISYENYFYYFKYSSSNNSLVNGGQLGLFPYLNWPTLSNINNKYSNLYGNFVKCTLHKLDENVSYITDENNEKYILLGGFYYPINDTPSINTNSLRANDVLLKDYKFKSFNNGELSIGSTAYFDYKFLKEWRLNYA